ncbi:MAG: hypothetical protein K2Y22_15120 [Candidatus Obscuribacterales bacterium]|nr:hypothetical protein [Candidatus Obscuribacterales bacterium]
MADTTGFGHLPGSNAGGGPLNRAIVDERLLAMFDSSSPPQDTIFILPVHIIFDEKDGYVSPQALRNIQKHASELEHWFGNGYTGETFALQGNLSRRQLAYVSRQPGVKYIWLLADRCRWTYSWPTK